MSRCTTVTHNLFYNYTGQSLSRILFCNRDILNIFKRHLGFKPTTNVANLIISVWVMSVKEFVAYHVICNILSFKIEENVESFFKHISCRGMLGFPRLIMCGRLKPLTNETLCYQPLNIELLKQISLCLLLKVLLSLLWDEKHVNAS